MFVLVLMASITTPQPSLTPIATFRAKRFELSVWSDCTAATTLMGTATSNGDQESTSAGSSGPRVPLLGEHFPGAHQFRPPPPPPPIPPPVTQGRPTG